MDLKQRWRIETLAGSTLNTETPMGVGPVAAVERAGLAMREVASVVPELPAWNDDWETDA